MSDETNRQDIEKETQSGLPTENKPADVEVDSEANEGSLPEEAKERTKAEFEKLKKANQELKAELDSLSPERRQSVLDSLRPQEVETERRVAPNAQSKPIADKGVDEVIDDLVDSEGYVDTARLKETLQKATRQTSEAIEEARKATQEARQASSRVSHFTETEEMKKVHADFPNLNPEGEKFDPVFFDLVRDRVIRQMTQGKQDVHLAAREISELYKPNSAKDEEAERARVEATTTAKEQINASGSSAPNRGSSQEDLVKGTMQGDRISMYERMKKSGY